MRKQSKALAQKHDVCEKLLQECYKIAEYVIKINDNINSLKKKVGESIFNDVVSLVEAKHAGGGVVLTLSTYKVVNPNQDIRYHKDDHSSGFSARNVDASVTVPFLEKKQLHRNVESHWLTRVFAISGPFHADTQLETTPKRVGPLVIKIINEIQNREDPNFAKDIVTIILYVLIKDRNRSTVTMTIPKGLPIDNVVKLLRAHFIKGYPKNAPRLPQCALYAIYVCLTKSVNRYKEFKLQKLERMKSADRKAGTVGDIELHFNERPIEAVEVKLERPVTIGHVREVISKVKSATVKRYFVLSTGGITSSNVKQIEDICNSFLKSNGCEIIVNGVYETIAYYLRLLNSTDEFINEYISILKEDPDIHYEHRVAWNEICDTEI